MSTIKIWFCGFWKDFDPKNNFILDILREKYTVVFDERPDFLFYSTFSADHLYHTDCVKIFYTNEAITPDFNECDYAVGFDYISFDDRYIRVDRTIPYSAEQKAALTQDMAKRKFCNFVYFNSHSGQGTNVRENFCKELAKYKHIDCPGVALNNMKDAISARFDNWEAGKMHFVKDYKFTIAFENCSKIGYVTEKIMHPLMVNSIPIYWGDPEITREFNPKAFVNCHDFANFAEVIEYIKYLDNDDQAYMQMLCAPPMQENYKQEPDKLKNFLYNIIERGNAPLPKDPRDVWDTKKKIIEKLLEEACFFHTAAGNIAKVEEYCGLAICLNNELTWPYKQLAKCYKNTENRCHTLPQWHQEKLLKNMTLSKMLAESLFSVADYAGCEKVLNEVLQRYPNSAWASDMLMQLPKK